MIYRSSMTMYTRQTGKSDRNLSHPVTSGPCLSLPLPLSPLSLYIIRYIMGKYAEYQTFTCRAIGSTLT